MVRKVQNEGTYLSHPDVIKRLHTPVEMTYFYDLNKWNQDKSCQIFFPTCSVMQQPTKFKWKANGNVLGNRVTKQQQKKPLEQPGFIIVCTLL